MKNSKKLLAILLFITSCLFLFTACGNKNDYTIVFDSNGGSLISEIGANSGDILNKPNNPTKDEYDFVDWFYDSELTQRVNWPIEVYDSLTVYAKWTPNTLKIALNENTISWKNFENGIYTIEIDNEIIDDNYTSNQFEISTDYNDGNYHAINITYNNLCQTYFYRYNAGAQTIAPTNFVVENSLLKWTWTNDNNQFDFTGFKIFVDGKYYTTQFAPQLVLKRFVEIADEKIYKIAVYATSSNAYDSNLTLTSYDHTLDTYQITLVFNDNINQNTTLTTDVGRISLPTPSRENYAFNGWYTSNNGGQALINKCDNNTIFFSNTILYAEWIQNFQVAGKTVLQSPAVSINDNFEITWSSVENTSLYLVKVNEVCEDGNYEIYSGISSIENRNFDFELYYLNFKNIIISIQAYGDGVTTVSSSPVCREINYYTYYKSVIGDVNYDPNVGVFYWNTADNNFDIEISKNSKTYQKETATNPEILIGKTTPSGELTIDVNKKKFTATNYRLANPTNIMILFDEDYGSNYHVGFDSDSNYDNIVVSYQENEKTFEEIHNTNYDVLTLSQYSNRTNYKFKLTSSSSNYFESDYVDLDFENTIQVSKKVNNFYFTNNNKILFLGKNYTYGLSGSGATHEWYVFKDITNNFLLEDGDFITEIYEDTYAENTDQMNPIYYVFALSNNGELFSWGYNNNNNFLLSNKQNIATSTPVNITDKFNLEDNEFITNINFINSYMPDCSYEVESGYIETNLGNIYVWGYNNGFMFISSDVEYINNPILISSKLALPQDDKIIYIEFSFGFAISNHGNIFKWNSDTTNTISSICSLSISGVAFCSEYYVIDLDNNIYLPQESGYDIDYYHWDSHSLNLDGDEYIISVDDEKITTNKNVYSISDF